MKTPLLRIKGLKALALSGLLFGALLPVSGKVQEGVDTLVNFNGKNGAQPQSIIQDSLGNFYGTTLKGGSADKGTVFEMKQSGELVTLITFTGPNGDAPEADLLLGPDGSLYGSTLSGGANNKGTIFKITPDGKFSTLLSFNGTNGAGPNSGLLLRQDGGIYGSTLTGGADDKGTIFKLVPGGQLTTVLSFDGTNGTEPGSLVLGNDGSFFGTANKGGAKNLGLIFKLTPDNHIETLLTFDGANGALPITGLVMAKNGDLYGTTFDGGENNLGTMYKITQDGKFTSLASFNGTDGAHPDSKVVEWNNGYFYMVHLWEHMLYKSSRVEWSGVNFCGTTSTGGAHGNGTVFKTTDSGSIMTLVAFTGKDGLNLGATPDSLIPGVDGNLYGTTGFGGTESKGTVFRLQLQIWPAPGVGEASATANFRAPVVSN